MCEALLADTCLGCSVLLVLVYVLVLILGSWLYDRRRFRVEAQAREQLMDQQRERYMKLSALHSRNQRKVLGAIRELNEGRLRTARDLLVHTEEWFP